MQKLDPYTIPLESINLIEASAGTGKSWTVTYLYLRLLLEKKLTVDQILVVTFTDAATKELRDDIRQRIVSALKAFENSVSELGYPENGEYIQLINHSKDHQESIRLLNRAKLSMDEAAVFTIHGFCQRSLSENAFEASLPFESELIADDSEIMQKLTDDFWRRFNQKTPKTLLFKLQQKSVTPDSLLQDIKQDVGKPYLEICGPLSVDEKTKKWEALKLHFQQVIESWRVNKDEIITLLSQTHLDAKVYTKALVDNRDQAFKMMNHLANANVLPEKIDKGKYNASANSKLFLLGDVKKVKGKAEPIEHPFFNEWQSFMDAWFEYDEISDDFLNHTRIELIQYLQEELPKEKQKLGVLSFDDLLLQLQKTLKSQPHLADDLRKKYTVALIDEFQDTDPIQYDIFHSIYPKSKIKDHAVFFVGDPKQAIYSFRGGDIHTYLNAKSDTQTQNTLEKNWRSHPNLIDAFNQLYSVCENPFKDEDIAYVKVDAGDKITDEISTTHVRSALNFWQYDFADAKVSVAKIRQEIADSIAGDIAQLLNDGSKGKAKIGDKAISGGDIAILIRSHNQADTIKSALNARGIPSVQNSRDSIYETHEAKELLYLLKAILNPQKEGLVRRALVTELMGYNSDDLLSFQEDSMAWEEILLAMQNWHQQWKKQGFLTMMRSFMKTENTHSRLLAFPDGERRISNVLQLSEIIHQSARSNMLGMVETLRWIKKQQLNANSNETELRLESDDDLVKIVTIHKSKGLEYPIVYCPYVGISGKENSDKVFSFYKNDKASLEMGSSDFEEHRILKRTEESAEDTRVLYVALTRAKYQCNVVCLTEKINYTSNNSALGWLLSNGKTLKEHKDDYFTSYKQNLQNLAKSCSNISLESLPQYPSDLVFTKREEKHTLVARKFKAIIKQQAQITSFSGLTAGAHDEAPDYDAIAVLNADLKTRLSKINEDEFPRGATAGTALHEIFEHVDFVKPITDQLELLNNVLDKYGFDRKYQPAATQLIQQSVNATLIDIDQNEFCLNQITKPQRLDEMEFYLPLERLDIKDLQQILYQYLPTDSSVDSRTWQSIREAVSSLYFEEVQGYLKGFIDLIFEHEGKYYLADYKSNSLVDYGQEAIFDAMAHSHYYLQYLFYSVALHRYLKQRVHDYSWETHIGGAYYLFIRGMNESVENPQSRHSRDVEGRGKTEQKWGGVFYDKPDLRLIEALDKLFTQYELAC